MSALLEVKDLSKSFSDKKVVEKLTLTVLEGEILGFLGPNGAGKSTTVKMIIDVEQRDDGEIYFNGEKTEDKMKVFKKALGVVPQDISIYDDLSAYDNVRFFCSLYGYKGQELKNRVKEALEFVGLWDRRKEIPSKFSGGMKRRLNIACSIAHSPKLLIMDEPTVGIDPQSRNHILETIKTLNKRGTTIVYVSHYMEEIDAICNRIVIMDHGIIVEDMEKERLKEKYRQQGFTSLEEIFLHLTGTDLRDQEA
ncbi:ABC transporter ATP-binding protein [Mobilitalea sibirica]|uniref:ABC transporter ATP-binding protein n=1 Tax=Mobilitalea sibirica TaxID=1462919 RepID=A0A8J7GXE7_9FIRM|nr:ABC transporter ATP-binding protein [Mobilitalea sibirica]MBH1939834.1 ABC transporter ATP-binding protein [Mobilitalea sibirica]